MYISGGTPFYTLSAWNHLDEVKPNPNLHNSKNKYKLRIDGIQ